MARTVAALTGTKSIPTSNSGCKPLLQRFGQREPARHAPHEVTLNGNFHG